MRVVNTDGCDADAPGVAGRDQSQRLFKARHGRAVAIGDLAAQAISSGIALVHNAAARIEGWRRKARDRRVLAALSNRELSDMGITRCDIPSIVEGTFVRGGWLGEMSAMFNANLPTPSNDTALPFRAPRRRRS